MIQTYKSQDKEAKHSSYLEGRQFPVQLQNVLDFFKPYILWGSPDSLTFLFVSWISPTFAISTVQHP